MGSEIDFDQFDQEAFIASVNNTLDNLLTKFKAGGVTSR